MVLFAFVLKIGQPLFRFPYGFVVPGKNAVIIILRQPFALFVHKAADVFEFFGAFVHPERKERMLFAEQCAPH